MLSDWPTKTSTASRKGLVIALSFPNIDILAGMSVRNSIPSGLLTTEGTNAYFEALELGKSDWKTAKLVLIGNGQIGKTTLMRNMLALSNSTIDVCC